MGRNAYPIATPTKACRDTAASNPLLGIPPVADVSSHFQTRPAVDRGHLPTAHQASPAFRVGQQVGVQLRTYIWVPGTIINAAYHRQYASVVYEIEYVAADGCWRREGFFPRDVRAHE